MFILNNQISPASRRVNRCPVLRGLPVRLRSHKEAYRLFCFKIVFSKDDAKNRGAMPRNKVRDISMNSLSLSLRGSSNPDDQHLHHAA